MKTVEGKVLRGIAAGIGIGVAVLATSPAAQASVIVQGTLQTIPGTPSNNGGSATEVDYWYFSVNAPGTVTIDTLSWEWDRDNDGTAHFMDPYIHLFNDDGALDAGDYITGNDDSSSTYGDGSTSSLDSYLSVSLGAGNYVLAISDFVLNTADAVSGVNTNGYYPAASNGSLTEYNYQGCSTLDCSFADYQITFTGDVTVQNAVEVPEPGTLAVLGAGLAGAAFATRRRRAR